MATVERGRKRILYIEDEPDVSRLVSQVLGLHGYGVIEAPRGTRGLEMLYEFLPHAVLLDMKMTVMNGYDVLEAAKLHSGLREIPVICVTALTDMEDVQRAFLLGADGYVFKPIDFELLLALLDFLTSEGTLMDRAHLLLDMPSFREAAEMAGREIDTLEKLEIALILFEGGETGFTRREVAEMAHLNHEDIAGEIGELEATGVVAAGRREGAWRINPAGDWPRRVRDLHRMLTRSNLYQAFINGIYTGVFEYGFTSGVL